MHKSLLLLNKSYPTLEDRTMSFTIQESYGDRGYVYPKSKEPCFFLGDVKHRINDIYSISSYTYVGFLDTPEGLPKEISMTYWIGNNLSDVVTLALYPPLYATYKCKQDIFTSIGSTAKVKLSLPLTGLCDPISGEIKYLFK